jgi:hypothetical protein
MARAIESLVATAGLAIERLQAHANSTRLLEAEARERLDALPPPADDDLPGAVKTRATLRVVCRSLRARLRETLRALEGARAAVDAALLAHHRDKTHVPGVAARPPQDGSSEGDVRAFASDVARIVEEAEEDGLFAALPSLPASGPGPGPGPVEETEKETTEKKTMEDSADITHLPDALFDELVRLGAGARRADRATTRLVVAKLAAAERDVDARAALAHEIETRFRVASPGTSPGTVPGTSYSSENFAYGTTSLRAWTRVVAACPALARAMRALAADAEKDPEGALPASRRVESLGDDGGESSAEVSTRALRVLEQKARVVVFGSSTGWLVFYAALAFGARSVGYELLEGRVATAYETARECVFSSDRESEKNTSSVSDLFAFSCSDALFAPLGENAKVVVLTSQCWDEALKTRVASRLASHLTIGALVVDYGDSLKRERAFGEPVAVVEAPTSWNEKQKFYVFQKKQ